MADPALISMSTLRRLGIFDGWTTQVEIPTSAGVVGVEYDKARQVVSFASQGVFRDSASARVKFRRLKFGLRPYFVCPQSGQPCLALIIEKGEAFCPDVFLSRSSPISQRKRRQQLRAAKRADRLVGAALCGSLPKELAGQLRRLPMSVPLPDALLASTADAKAHGEKARQKLLWDLRPLGTVKALDCGRGAGQFSIYERYIAEPPQHHVAASRFSRPSH